MRKFLISTGAILLALYGVRKVTLAVWIHEGVQTYNYINRIHNIDDSTGLLALNRLLQDVSKNSERHLSFIRTNHKAVRTHLVDEYLSHVATIRAEQKANFNRARGSVNDSLLDELSEKLKSPNITNEEVKKFISENFGISAKDQHQIDDAYSKMREQNDE